MVLSLRSGQRIRTLRLSFEVGLPGTTVRASVEMRHRVNMFLPGPVYRCDKLRVCGQDNSKEMGTKVAPEGKRKHKSIRQAVTITAEVSGVVVGAQNIEGSRASRR